MSTTTNEITPISSVEKGRGEGVSKFRRSKISAMARRTAQTKHIEELNEKMTPFTPDLTPTTYESEKGLRVFYVCSNHTPPYYSKQKPVEVRLS